MSRWYLCRYDADIGKKAHRLAKSWVGQYSSYIWAGSPRRAREKAKRRGIGEVVEGRWSREYIGRKPPKRVRELPYQLPSVLVQKRRLSHRDRLDIIHGVTFLVFLLMNCRKAPSMLDHSKMLVGDHGILHQVIHSLSFGEPRRSAVASILQSLERSVPGYVAA